MHQIIKPTCHSRQLFIKITFVFIKIFDFLVKIAIFGAFLFRSRDSRHALLPEKKSKIFSKAKVIFMKSCLLGHVGFMIRCIFDHSQCPMLRTKRWEYLGGFELENPPDWSPSKLLKFLLKAKIDEMNEREDNIFS